MTAGETAHTNIERRRSVGTSSHITTMERLYKSLVRLAVVALFIGLVIGFSAGWYAASHYAYHIVASHAAEAPHE